MQRQPSPQPRRLRYIPWSPLQHLLLRETITFIYLFVYCLCPPIREKIKITELYTLHNLHFSLFSSCPLPCFQVSIPFTCFKCQSSPSSPLALLPASRLPATQRARSKALGPEVPACGSGPVTSQLCCFNTYPLYASADSSVK